MNAVLRAADLSGTGFVELLTGLRFPEGLRVRAWLEGIDGWSLDYWPGIDGEVLWYGAGRGAEKRSVNDLLPQLQAGRIFANSGELRWRLLTALGSNPWRVVYLGEDNDKVSALAARPELNGKTAQRSEHPLCGLQTDHTPEEWIELRIPHRFRYPVEVNVQGDRIAVKAVVETWVDECGEPHFHRFRDLQPYVGE